MATIIPTSPSKKRGPSRTPPQQRYFARPGRRLKVHTQQAQALVLLQTGTTDQLTAAQRGAVAFFLISTSRDE